jgi:hypothetical protein
MGKDQGTDYALYLSDDDPGSNNYGSINQYEIVGFATENSLNFDKNLIESADKDTSGDMTYVSGRRTPTVEGTFHLDVQQGNDAGQQNIFNNIQKDTNERLFFLLTDNVVGNLQFYGECYTESMELTFPDQDMIELSATLQVHGGVTIDAVT